jgi:lysophospholipase L1-like esterase
MALGAAALLAAAELALRARYRWRVLPRAAPIPGQITIVALGDSIVAGTPGEVEDAWPARLAEFLVARSARPGPTASRARGDRPRQWAGDRPQQWRVLNAGVPGDTAPQGYARFDRDVAAAGPQIVLIAFGLNDCNPARYGLDRWREAQVPRGLGRSYLWRAARARIVRWVRQIGWLAEPEAEPDYQPFPRTSPQGFADTLDALVARTWEIGAQPVLLTMTPLAAAATAEVRARAVTYPVYNDIIRARAARNGVPLVELALASSLVGGAGVPADGFEPDGLHPSTGSLASSGQDGAGQALTASGQAWVAEQVFVQLNRVGLW